MSVAATVPVTITPEAAAHLHGLGLEREHAQMVEYMQKCVPDSLRIETMWACDRDSPVPDPLVVPAVLPEPDEIDLSWEHARTHWFITTFPYAIRCHFVLTTRYEARHGG